MKTLIMSLVTFVSITSNAGGFGQDSPVDTTVFSCFKIAPVQEGVAVAGLQLSGNGLQMGFSNHVNDFNVSFEPVKVIAKLNAAAQLREQSGLLVAESENKEIKITISAVEILASTGTVSGQIEANGQAMQGTCSVNLNNLKVALQ
jgi:hypothetical protein